MLTENELIILNQLLEEMENHPLQISENIDQVINALLEDQDERTKHKKPDTDHQDRPEAA